MSKVTSSHITFTTPLGEDERVALEAEHLSTLNKIDTVDADRKHLAAEFNQRLKNLRKRERDIRLSLQKGKVEHSGIFPYERDFERGLRVYMHNGVEVFTEPLSADDRQKDLEEDISTNNQRNKAAEEQRWTTEDGANWVLHPPQEDGGNHRLFNEAFPSDLVGEYSNPEDARADTEQRAKRKRQVEKGVAPAASPAPIPQKKETVMVSDSKTPAEVLAEHAGADEAEASDTPRVKLSWGRDRVSKDGHYRVDKDGTDWMLADQENPGDAWGPFKAYKDAKVFAQALQDGKDVEAAWVAVVGAGGQRPQEDTPQEDAQQEENQDDQGPSDGLATVIARRVKYGVGPFDWSPDGSGFSCLIAEAKKVSPTDFDVVLSEDPAVVWKEGSHDNSSGVLFGTAKEATDFAEACLSHVVTDGGRFEWMAESKEWVEYMPF